nr:MAG TPA: hypothetical protein [Microviridae sp.]
MLSSADWCCSTCYCFLFPMMGIRYPHTKKVISCHAIIR